MNARLEVTDALGRRTVTVEKSTFSIGRRSTNDLRVGGSDVSRDHAEIMQEAGRFVLHDLGSRYGTFVNGEQVTERALVHGDRIRLGRSGEAEMVFLSQEGKPPEPPERQTTSAASDLRQIAALLEGLRALSASRVLDDVLALVLDSAIDVSGAERGFIMLGSETGTLEFKLARARGRITLTGSRFETSRKIPEEVFATGRDVLVADILDGDLAGVHMGTVALGIRTVLCMPLRLLRFAEERPATNEQARTIGVLYLDSHEKGPLLSRGARNALETLAAEAAVAIENARLYREALIKAQIDQELRIAAEMQQALLPRGGRTGEFFEAAAITIPCRAIGGDFFDYQETPTAGFGFAVGDVAGKGAPAALMTAVLQGIFSAQAAPGLAPGATFERVNIALARRAIEARFATMVYGMLERDGTLVYSNAGHNPPFLIRRDGSSRRLDCGGVILGLFEGARYEDERLQLEDGDVLVLFSDGVSEALSVAEEEFGDQRLLATVLEHCDDPAQGLLDRLLAAVKTFAAGRLQNDDVTAMLVRYRRP